MPAPMKVFVWGSPASNECVTRAQNMLSIAHVSSHSFIAAMSAPLSLPQKLDLSKTGKLKQESIKTDFFKRLKTMLAPGQFDLILIDFLAELATLEEVAKNRFITISPGLMETGYVPKGETINFKSERMLPLWLEAWSKFMQFASSMGLCGKIALNRLLLASRQDNGQPFAKYDDIALQKRNAWLSGLYSEAARWLPADSVISYPDAMLVGKSNHQWGAAPYNYADSLYSYGAERLKSLFHSRQAGQGRRLAWHKTFVFGDESARPVKIISNGSHAHDKGKPVSVRFSQKDKYYYARFILPELGKADGLTITFRLAGWADDHTWQLAWMKDTVQYRIRGKHWQQGDWQTVSVGRDDLLFSINNPQESMAPQVIDDIRLMVAGDFVGEGQIDVADISIWKQDEDTFHVQKAAYPAGLMEYFIDFMKKLRPDWRKRYNNFLKTGSFPADRIDLDWPIASSEPVFHDNLPHVLHCLIPAQHMLLAAHELHDPAALCAARDFIARWLRQPPMADNESGRKWHAHVTAERQLAFILMLLLGRQYDFDHVFMRTLTKVAIAQARLLASEPFYVSSQGIRVHNHGMFQNLALLLSAIVLAEDAASSFWWSIAMQRQAQMLNEICNFENGFAVCVENSLHYHALCQEMTLLFARIAPMAKNFNHYFRMAMSMRAWSELWASPKGRFGIYGDTYREGSGKRLPDSKSAATKNFYFLPKSGFAHASGRHADSCYKLAMLGSSLSATHKHEDNLALILAFDGLDWLIDPSFFSYQPGGKSAYLRSAAAHNCLHIQKLSYSLQPGKCSLTGTAHCDDFFLSGTHSCYAGFVLKRTLRGNLNELDFQIEDSISVKESGLRMRLQCGEGVKSRLLPGCVELTHQASRYMLRIDCDLPAQIITGQANGGIAGKSFCQCGVIETIEFNCAQKESFTWRIRAVEAILQPVVAFKALPASTVGRRK